MMIVGVDIGTSVTKAALFDHDGRSTKLSRTPSQVLDLGEGRFEQDLEEVLKSVATVVRNVTKDLDDPIEAIALTGQGDGLWLRDDEGKAVRQPILWLDARASEIVRRWRAGGRSSVLSKVAELTGSGVFPGSQAALLAYLAENEPDSLDKATVAGYCVDAVLQRLTGLVSVDASDASLPFMDVTTRRYVHEAFQLCGVEKYEHLLAKPAQPHAVFRLDRHGSELLGLPEGTPITAGPYDLEACAFGSGTTDVGAGSMVIGSTLACAVLTTDAGIRHDQEPAGMWLCTPNREQFLRVMPSMVGTVGVDWLTSLFGLDATAVSGMLAATSPGASGVRALSFLSPSGERAPFVDPGARGQLVGLDLSVGRAEMVRALCESIAFVARSCFEELGLTGELTASGGGIRSRQWAQLFADVLASPIYIADEEFVGARGAALVAWESLGNPVDPDLWRTARHVFEPDASAAASYEAGFAQYNDDLAQARALWAKE